MTQQQQSLYDKFLAKAFAEDLHIVGHGTVKATGQRFIAVTSSDGSGVYTVTIAGHDLHCNCPAGMNGHYCKHRALARYSIEEKAAQAATAPQGATYDGIADPDRCDVRIPDQGKRFLRV